MVAHRVDDDFLEGLTMSENQLPEVHGLEGTMFLLEVERSSRVKPSTSP